MKKSRKTEKSSPDIITPELISRVTREHETYQPRNKKEEELLKEIKAIIAKGYIVDIPYDWV